MASKKAPAAAAAAAGQQVVQSTARGIAPLLAAPVSLAAGGLGIDVMHHYWGGSPTATPLYALGMTFCGACATWYAHAAAGKHRTHLRWLSAATAAAGTAGTVSGLIFGLGGAVEGAYIVGSIGLTALWTIRHLMKGAGAGEGGHALGHLGEAIGLEKHRVSEIRQTGRGTVTAVVKATGGATIDEFQSALPRLAAAAGLPKGGAVLRADDDDSSVGYLELTVADLLKHTLPWPGIAPAALGELPTEPIALGVYANGTPFYGHALTPDGDIEHTLVVGVTGSGKSEFALAYLGTQLTRRQVSVIGVDCTKGLQTFGPIVHAMSSNGMVVTNQREARALLKALAGPVCKARTAYLTSQGMTKWAPRTPRGQKCAINLLHVWIEEATDLADAKAYEEMLRRCRSAGIIIETSLQRAVHDKLDTSARASHGGGIAFGCREIGDAAMALPDEVIEAGAAPTWRNRKPGYCYAAALGADPDLWATRLRMFYIHDRGALAAAVTAAATHRDPMDEITARALGSLWDKRTRYARPEGLALTDSADMQSLAALAAMAPAAIGPAPAAAAVPAARPAEAAVTGTVARPAAAGPRDRNDPDDTDDTDDTDDLEEEMTEQDYMELEEAEEEILGGLRRARIEQINRAVAESGAPVDPEDEYDDPDADITADIPDGDDDVSIDFGGGPADGTRYSPEQARRALREQLAAWERDGKRDFQPSELYPLLEQVGRGRRWFYHERDALVDAGVLAEGDEIGTWDIIGNPLAGVTAGQQ